MKTNLKYLAVVFILSITVLSFAQNKTCHEHLYYNIPGMMGNRGKVNEINVTGSYIYVRWDVAKVYTGGNVDVYIRDEWGTDMVLKNGKNRVEPGKYMLHMDWYLLISADVTIEFECGYKAKSTSLVIPNANTTQRSDNSKGFIIHDELGHGRKNENKPLSSIWPGERTIRAALSNFSFNYSNYASIDEATHMLQYIGAEEISVISTHYVSGIFQSGAEITIWPNTYNKRSCYGIRYGIPQEGRPYFGSNNTYFEICK